MYWPRALKKQRNLEVFLIYFMCVLVFQQPGVFQPCPQLVPDPGSSSATRTVTVRFFRNATACQILILSQYTWHCEHRQAVSTWFNQVKEGMGCYPLYNLTPCPLIAQCLTSAGSFLKTMWEKSYARWNLPDAKCKFCEQAEEAGEMSRSLRWVYVFKKE